MPAAHVHVLEGHPRECLRRLIAEVSDVMADVLAAPKERLEVWVTEVDPELWGVAGRPASELLAREPHHQVEMPFVQVHVLAGRPVEQHHQLIARITAAVEATLGSAPGRTRVGIVEIGPDRWGIGGQPASVVRAAEIAARAAGAAAGAGATSELAAGVAGAAAAEGSASAP